MYLRAMLIGFTASIVIETAVLLACLSRKHPVRHRLFAGVWLTACTYPIVWLVLPGLFHERWMYLAVAETFAPLAECAIFSSAFRATWRDRAAIVAANLLSFALGEAFHHWVGWKWLMGV